jgi:hypothetical protein
MNYVKSLVLLVAAAATLMAFTATASATSVTTTTGGAAATPAIHAVTEGGHVKLANNIANIECASTFQGNVESHGAGSEAKGNFGSFEFTGCTNGWHATVTFKGGFGFSWTSGETSIFRILGLEVSFTRFLVPCTYEANNTTLGTVTGGSPATLKIEGSLPIGAGSSELCGSGNAKMEGSYVMTSALYAAP